MVTVVLVSWWRSQTVFLLKFRFWVCLGFYFHLKTRNKLEFFCFVFFKQNNLGEAPLFHQSLLRWSDEWSDGWVSSFLPPLLQMTQHWLKNNPLSPSSSSSAPNILYLCFLHPPPSSFNSITPLSLSLFLNLLYNYHPHFQRFFL